MRAVVVNAEGDPELREIAEPGDAGEVVRVLACGLCGSDVEKLRPEAAGTVLGHEVAAATADGRRVVLVHHLPCEECERCRAGHESTCEHFRAPTIVPGGFAERVAARGGYLEAPPEIDAATATYAEPLACVLRGAERIPPGKVLVVGGGFIGRLFEQALRRRGDEVHVYDLDPARSDGEPPGLFPSVVLAAPTSGLEHVEPGGLALVFAPTPQLDLDRVYRDEITVAGSRSATPRHLKQAIDLLPELDLPAPIVFPLERFREGLELYLSRGALKVVFRP